MPITITLDNDDLRNTPFLRATARYFSDLAGEPQTHSISTHTAATAGDTGAIRDDENEQVGVDADRPNVPPAPDTADVETLPTVPAEPTDIFGKANVSPVDAAPIVPEAPAPSEDAVPTPPASGAELDSNGLPWDARIHASTKAKVADGSWRALRGVDKNLVTVVEQELRELMAIPSPLIVSGGKDMEYAIDIPSPNDVAVPAPVEAEAIAPTPTTNTQGTSMAISVPEFVQWMMVLIKDGKITMAKCNEGIASTGAKGLPDLTVRKDLIPAAKLAIEGML